MANKKINELQTRTPSLSDLMLVGDPSSGYSYKCTVTSLATIIETDIADGYVTIGTTQTISGAKTFSNNLTLTSVSNAGVDTDKFLVLNGSNVVNFRTGSEVLSDIGGQGALTLTTTGTSGAATLVGNTLNIPNYAPDLSGYVPTSRTITINGTTQDLTANRTYNVGTVISVAASAGTGISISGSPITTSGTITITNTAPDQIVALTAGTGISVSGTYPNFTITNSSPSSGGTVTSVALSAPTGFAVTGSPITSSGTLALAFSSGYSLPTTASQSNWNSAYDNMIVSAAVTGTTTKTLTLTQQDAGTITASWSDLNTDAVTSVFGRTGAVVAANGDYTTAQVTESGNLYYTDARARASLSAGTGISYSSTTGVISSTITQYTDALARAAISLTTTGSSGSATYSSTTGVLNVPTYTLAGLGGISLSSLSASAPLSYNSGTGVFSISQANTTTNGFLSSTDWNTFNNKLNAAVTSLNGLTASTQTFATGTSGTDFAISSTTSTHTFNLPTASATNRGALSSADWSTFNGKQSAITLTTTGTSGAATFVSNTLNIPQYQAQGNYITSLTGEATGSGAGAASVTLTNSAVIGKILTGLNITGGTVAATDSILTAFGKVQNQINGLAGGVTYQGTWNASTNTPTLTSSTGTKGFYYVVSVAGSTNLNGITDWKLGDWAIYNGTSWEKVDNTDAVVSVNGYTGTVSLSTTDITEGTNLYFTNARARSAISLTTTGSSGASTYSSSTGVLNVPTYTLAGLGGISLTSLSASAPLSYNNTTGAFSISQASGSTNGFLSSTDWTTFNNKQNALTNPVTGTGTTNYIPKFTSSSAIGNSAIYDASGSIGIGTTAPGSKLEIKGGSGNQLVLNNGGETFTQQYWQNNGTNIGAIWASLTDFSIYTYSSQPIIFWTNGSERMRLDASGNLGLGTSSPATKLDVNGGAIVRGSYSGFTGGELLLNAGANQQVAISTNGTGTTEMYFDHRGTNTGLWLWRGSSSTKMTLDASGNLGLGVTPSAWSVVAPGFQVKAASMSSYDNGVNIGANFYYNGSNDVYINNGYATLYQGYLGKHIWSIAPSGTAGNAISFTQAMTLDASGRLGIGTTSPNYKLDIKGGNASTLRLDNDNSQYVQLLFERNTTANTGADFLLDGTGGTFGIRTLATYPITFSTSASAGSPTERMRITSGGNVGIGTTSPTARLHSYSGTSMNQLTVDGVGAIKSGINFANGGTTYGQIYFDNNAPYDMSILQQYITGSLILGTNSTERMRITSGGNVGIGTTNPNSLLVVNGASSSPIFRVTGGGDGSGGGKGNIRSSDQGGTNFWDFGRDNLTTGNFMITPTSGTPSISITSGGNVGIGTTSPNTPLSIVANHVSGQSILKLQPTTAYASGGISSIGFNNSDGTRMGLVYQNSDGLQLETTTAVPIILNTNASERMRITSGGELLINTTTDAGDYKLQVNGQGYFTESGTTSGIYINNSTATNFSKITFNNSGASGRSMDIGLGGSTSSQPNTFYIYDNTAAATRMTINSSGNTEFGGSIKTAAPAGYTAREWKLGEKVDASVSLDQDKYIAIDIGGTVYYLALVKLN